MGNTIDGSITGNRTAPVPSDSNDQSAQNFQAELLKQTSGKAQYAAAEDLAKHAREQYNQAHGGGSTIGNWWYNDRDYLSPAQKKLYDQAQHSNDVERAGDVSVGAVAARSAGDTAFMGLTELAHDAATYKMGDKSWAENASENKENREAAERLHPWASRTGTVAGVATWAVVGWESGAAKAVVSSGGAALRAAGVGAAMGAVNGATHNDGSVREAATSAVIGGTFGGATGAIGAKVSEAVAPYVSRLASNLSSTELRGGLKPLGQGDLATHWGGTRPQVEGELPPPVSPGSTALGSGEAGSAGQAAGHGPEPAVPPGQPTKPETGSIGATPGRGASPAAGDAVDETLANGAGKGEKLASNGRADANTAREGVTAAPQATEAADGVRGADAAATARPPITRLAEVSLSDNEIHAGFDKLADFRKSTPTLPDKWTGNRKFDDVATMLRTGRREYFGESGWMGKTGTRLADVKTAHKAAGFKPNGRTITHAEGHVFDQALRANDKGGVARLFVDSTLCDSCGDKFKGVQNMIKPMGYEKLEVYTKLRDGSIEARILLPR